MICKRCGSQIFNNAKTCPFCAAVVGTENETDLTQNVIPSLEEIENPGNQMPDLTAPVQPPAAPATPPAQNNPFGSPAVQPPAQNNPFGNPAVQPPAQNDPFGTPAVQPPAQNGAFGNPAVQPPAQNDAFGTPEVQPSAQNDAFGTPAVQPPAQNNPFGDQTARPAPQQNAFGAPQQSAAFSQSPPQSSFAPLPPLGGTGASGGAIAGIPIRLITKIVIVLALLGFALPFVTVSCSMGDYGGDQEIATYSGFDLMAGNLEYEDPAKQMNDSLSGIFGEEFVNNEDEDEISDFDAIFNQGDEDAMIGYHDISEEDDSAAASAETDSGEAETQRKNYYLIAAFICGVIGLVLFFIRDKKLELFTMLLCMLSALLTLFSSFNFSSFYHVTDDAQMAELIKVKTRFGLFTVVVLFVIGALGALKEHIDVNRNSGY